MNLMKPLSLFIVLLMLVIPISSCSVPTTTKPTTTVVSPQVSEQKVKAEIKKFEDAIAEIDNPANVAQEKLHGLMSKTKTQSDLIELITVARQTKQIFDESPLKVSLIEIDNSLPSEVKQALEEVKSNTQLSYSYRSDALESLLKFLDEQKPSLMADYKSQSEQANDASVAASLALAQAYFSAGK